MNVLWLLLPAIAILVIGGRLYGRHIERVFGVDDTRPTPAAAHDDNRDLIKTRVDVAFAHHFAAIAGTGPIVGPVFALAFGFLPVWMWLLLGGLFLGAVHDFGSLFVSLREGAKSIPTVARKSLGRTGYVLFVLFFLLMIILVTSVFLNASAASLTSRYPVDKLNLAPDQTLLRTEVIQQGGQNVLTGVIGGIASTGVFIITFLAIPLGFVQRRGLLRPLFIHLIGTVICVLSIVVGFMFPISLNPDTWKYVLTFYTLVAAGVPLWLILQPRDVINVQILYGGIALLFVSLFAGGATGLSIEQAPATLAFGIEKIGALWPFLFVTVACGAISGFHCMVSGGTTSRQIACETDARRVAYNAMLLETLLAITVLLTLASSLPPVEYSRIVWPTQSGASSNPIFAFALAAGTLFHNTLGIPLAIGCVFGILTVEGFIVTTLDTAVRLNRYLFEELWDIMFRGQAPAFMRNYWFNASLSAGLMLNFGWLLFGTANQAVASLALIAISAWLLLYGRRFAYTLIPAILMLGTTVYAFLLEIFQTHPVGSTKNTLYQVSAIVLAVLAFGVIGVTIKTFLFRAPAPIEAEPVAE